MTKNIYKVLFSLNLMKKGKLYLFLFSLIILAGIATATTNSCWSSTQVIISLSNQDNSHGALWNDANYNYKV